MAKDDRGYDAPVVIIGAGGTGRGFIARLLYAQGQRVCFIDESSELVAALQGSKQYNIYVGRDRRAVPIRDYQAYNILDKRALISAADAPYMFVSVGEQNLAKLTGFFEALCDRKSPQTINVIVCENGLSPKDRLRQALSETRASGIRITQSAIFCTSVPVTRGALDILSEDYPQMPYDVDEALFTLPYANFCPKHNFQSLLLRKIYTYNCISALIAYLGYVKGYDVYADAANDERIGALCETLRDTLDDAICAAYNVERDEQRAFSRQAISKFRDRTIADTIQKNARDVQRKIAPNERLMGPARIIEARGGDINILCEVIAWALRYMEREENTIYQGMRYDSAFDVFLAINALSPAAPISETVKRFYIEAHTSWRPERV